MTCEFCSEFSNPGGSRFASIYGPAARERIVAAYDRFVALPTIGQIFPGSMLVLPVDHIETLASLSLEALDKLNRFVDVLQSTLSSLGTPVYFEHGARCGTGGGCGIYHAHLHIVPVSGSITWRDVLPTHAKFSRTMPQGFAILREAREYLLFRGTDGKIAFLDLVSEHPSAFPSQYFRRMLVRHFKLPLSWDWRGCRVPEVGLLDSLSCFQKTHVSIGE